MALLPYTTHGSLRGGTDHEDHPDAGGRASAAPGDIVEVKDGYGRNYLLPQGFAIGWTKGAEKQVQSSSGRATPARSAAWTTPTRSRPSSRSSRSRCRHSAGDTGRLFGSVTPAEIADAVKSAGGPLVDKRAIAIAPPIKTTGTHQVSVQLHPEVAATVRLEVAAV